MNFKSFRFQLFLFCLLFVNIIFLIVPQSANAEDVIQNIIIERKNVFEPTDKDWFFGAKFLNSLHSVTKEYIIEDELIFKVGDFLEEDKFLETERNLNSTGLFTTIKIELEEVSHGLFDVYVETKDRWSLFPAIILGANGGEYFFGGRIKDYNLFGHGLMLNIDGAYIYRSDTNGYIGNIELEKQRLFRTELKAKLKIYKTYLRDGQQIDLEKPFRTVNTKTSYGISASNLYGDDFFLNRNSNIFLNLPSELSYIDSLKFIQSSEQKIKLWYTNSWLSNDKVYISTLFEWQQADRSDAIFNRAFDNQSKFLVGFSSVAQTYYTVKNINSHSYEDLAVGGWGSAILGAIFPSNKNGEKGSFYVGAHAEKSYYSKNLYLFGKVLASSTFLSDFAKYTYQEFLGLAFIKLSDKLTVAARIKEQAAWNNPRMRQLILDDIRGVRGYNLQGIAGDNRFVANLELRYFSDFQISVIQFSGVAFFDIGSVWNQRVENSFFNSKFYSSVGLGLRGHFTKSNNPDHILRADIPFNFHTKQFGISLGVQQYFSVISNHSYKLPTVFGEEFDYE